MRSGRASRTAEHNALFRSLEAGRPPGDRLFDDPLASWFLTWPLKTLAPAIERPVGSRAVSAVIDRRWPGVRSSVAARTRLIDDTLEALPDRQLAQLVILGAGFDTRAYRLECLRDVRVFEVDHPDTQAVKTAVLEDRLPGLPGNVSYVPTDFHLRALGDVMAAAGYRPESRTVFVWEGVSNYLSEAAVDATLRWCAGTGGPGSSLIFTYVDSAVLDNPGRFVGGHRLHATLDKVGEQLTFGMDPDLMGTYLAERGLRRVWDHGAAEYRARYFGDRAAAMVGHEFYRVALAVVDAAPGSASPGSGAASGGPLT